MSQIKFFISDEQLVKSRDQGNIITETLECSPVQFQLKRKVELIDDNTKKHLSKKFKRLQDSLRSAAESMLSQLLQVRKNLLCRFCQFQPMTKKKKKYQITFSTICNCIKKVMLLGKW